MNKINAFDVLKERGFIKQTVYEEDLIKLLSSESVSFYVGFDPTADSLHIGHYIPIMAMAHMQRAGHRPIALIGGGTGMIGDPSNRTDMRQMMTREIVDKNCAAFREQMNRFIRFDGENAALMVNNADWLMPLNYIEFIRDIGCYFSVNKMLTAECFKSRLEKGLSFLEFNYMLMQGYDFLYLYQNLGVKLQMGGNDQWSNILAGADLIRRKESADAFAMTLSLLESSDGKKMGKTQKGALWLDKNKTTPYEFYQYFRNVEDVKVNECFRLLTFLEMSEINELTKHNDERMNDAKKRLAFEVTKLVHGEEEATLAELQSVAAFSNDSSQMPSIELECNQNSPITDIMFDAKLVKTKSEARRLIEGGGIRINDTKVESVNSVLSQFNVGAEFILHKGKKIHFNIIIK